MKIKRNNGTKAKFIKGSDNHVISDFSLFFQSWQSELEPNYFLYFVIN